MFGMTKKISDYQYMWTSEIDKHWLINNQSGTTIFHGERLGFITIEDNAIYEEVLRNLKQNGAKQLTSYEFAKYMASINPWFVDPDDDIGTDNSE
jgi:hypothetical protein